MQAQDQPQLDALSKEGRAKFGFVDYDRPTFVVVSKQTVLQMTLKIKAKFDPEKFSIYKRAAQILDLFVAPKKEGRAGADTERLAGGLLRFFVS